MGKPTFDICNSKTVPLAGLGHGQVRSQGFGGDVWCGLEHRFWTCRYHQRVFNPEYIGVKSEPGELKHLSTRRKGHQRDSVNSGERTRIRPVL